MAGANKGNLLKNSQPLFKELCHAKARPVKRVEEGYELFQIRVPHGLIKAGQQWLREVAFPRQTI